MGCGTSSPATTEKRAAGGAEQSRKQSYAGSPGLADERAYIGDVFSITSGEYRLFAEMDAKTVSEFEAADEPSDAMYSLRVTAIVMRGKMKFDITEDPDQFDARLEIPEFKQRDKKRVTDWARAVAAVVAVEGMDDIPTNSFYLPVHHTESHASSNRNVFSETGTSSAFELQLQGTSSSIGDSSASPSRRETDPLGQLKCESASEATELPPSPAAAESRPPA